jgi:hypothetical protein
LKNRPFAEFALKAIAYFGPLPGFFGRNRESHSAFSEWLDIIVNDPFFTGMPKKKERQ